MEIEIKFFDKQIEERYKVEYTTDGSAAVDIRACLTEKHRLLPGGSLLIPAGFAIHINDSNVAAVLLPRSGFAYKEGLILGNTVGLIDSDYQAQIFVAALNRSKANEIIINPYDRIAQMMFIPVIRATFKKVEKFAELTKRGKGGFGSTGKS